MGAGGSEHHPQKPLVFKRPCHAAHCHPAQAQNRDPIAQGFHILKLVRYQRHALAIRRQAPQARIKHLFLGGGYPAVVGSSRINSLIPGAEKPQQLKLSRHSPTVRLLTGASGLGNETKRIGQILETHLEGSSGRKRSSWSQDEIIDTGSWGKSREDVVACRRRDRRPRPRAVVDGFLIHPDRSRTSGW